MRVIKWLIINLLPATIVCIWVVSQFRTLDCYWFSGDAKLELYGEWSYLQISMRPKGWDWGNIGGRPPQLLNWNRIPAYESRSFVERVLAAFGAPVTGRIQAHRVTLFLPWWFLLLTSLLVISLFTDRKVRNSIATVIASLLMLCSLTSIAIYCHSVWIRIEAVVEVTDPRPADQKGRLTYPQITNPDTLMRLHGESVGGTISDYHDYGGIDVEKGNIHLEYHPKRSSKIWVVTQYQSPRRPTRRELDLLVEQTRIQWTSGWGEDFDYQIGVSKTISLDLYPDNQELRLYILKQPGYEP